MVDAYKDPSPNELLQRIVRLENRTAKQQMEIAALTQRLEKEIEQQKVFSEMREEIVDKHYDHEIKVLYNALLVAFERINALCVKVLPGFVQDKEHLKTILGPGEGRVWNPLDHTAPRTNQNPKD